MQKKLKSTAFPEGHNPQRRSFVHQILDQPYQVIRTKIREFEQDDMSEVVALHQQWFPLQYGNSFYNRIQTKNVKCQIAEAEINQNGEVKKIIVGILVFDYEDAGSLLKRQKWSEYFYWNYISIYIMTLGVIDEFRSLGLGNKFLALLINLANINTNIKYIHLHMVAYNSAARFYEKNGFEVVDVLRHHYHDIKGKAEDAKHYALFCNGGVRRVGWKEWIQSAWSKNKQQQKPEKSTEKEFYH